MLKLKDELQFKTIEMSELKEGQIAVVVEDFNAYKGRVVQRYGDNALVLGMSYGNGWTEIQYNTLKVRVLEEGETLVISRNK
jgi:hypothetical protein